MTSSDIANGTVSPSLGRGRAGRGGGGGDDQLGRRERRGGRELGGGPVEVRGGGPEVRARGPDAPATVDRDRDRRREDAPTEEGGRQLRVELPLGDLDEHV